MTQEKIQTNQIPVIVQANPLEYTGNGHFYSIIESIPDSLTNIKNMIEESFISSQESIIKIDKAIRDNGQ
jgi:hypothetical protein